MLHVAEPNKEFAQPFRFIVSLFPTRKNVPTHGTCPAFAPGAESRLLQE